jgi:hypothetical protein
MRLREAVASIAADFAERSCCLGRAVQLDPDSILSRDIPRSARLPGRSVNGSCQLVQARDGWIALNLARPEDAASVAAWLECDIEADPWPAAAEIAPQRSVAHLLDRAMLLSLPVAMVGEAHGAAAVRHHNLSGARRAADQPLAVLDIATLWAGPLCAGLLAEAGADVTRIDNRARPDPTAAHTPALDRRINGGKRRCTADLSRPAGRAMLLDMAASADVLVTSARARGLASLGLTPELVFAANPGLIWVAITAHGWDGAAGTRVGFGDDCAAAGGLIDDSASTPAFIGDALADPLTGLLAASAVFDMVAAGTGGLIDIALARSAGQVAAML